jgi:hypothetical protein
MLYLQDHDTIRLLSPLVHLILGFFGGSATSGSAAGGASTSGAAGGSAGVDEVVKIRYFGHKKTISDAVKQANKAAHNYSIMFELAHLEKVNYQRIKKINFAIANSNKNLGRKDKFNLEDLIMVESEKEKKKRVDDVIAI